ncbi:MAG: carbon starvation CstA family protein [Mucinivorans sp.]
MYSFLTGIALLVVGYFTYGLLIEKVLKIDPKRVTPAYKNQDGVDFVPMATWRVYLIQFLNIAGLGPIFGAVMGAKFGVSAYLWIVLGTIFAGATHDMIAGVLSMRHDGESLPETIGRYLGVTVKQLIRGFSVVLMILVGAVFVAGPATLLAKLTPSSLDYTFWLYVIFGYYLLATLLPIDKLIGRIYPVFAVALFFMALAMLGVLVWQWPSMPEVTDGLQNTNPNGMPIFPMMFISIACGAISGFHATQSPLMARCMKNERHARPVFYGAMVSEGIVAMIWAAVAIYFFHTPDGAVFFADTTDNAAVVVDTVMRDWLGPLGAMLAMLGVIAAPITSGDTALRSARLIVADFTRLDQRQIIKRLMIVVPLFALTFVVLQLEFGVIWRYFAWANQTLAVFTLWALTVYLVQNSRYYWITLIPALFMTAVCSTYILMADTGFGININISYIWGAVVTLGALGLFMIKQKKHILR